MSDIFKSISELNLWYVPIVVTIFFVLLGATIGFINGWKAATYFASLNIIILLVAVFAGKFIIDKSIDKWIDKIVGKSDNLGKAITSNSHIIFGVLLLVAILGMAIIVNLLGLIPYIFLRKLFKKSIKINKERGHSNITSRVIGSGIGVISIIPITVALTGLSVASSNNKEVNKFFSHTTKSFTFGTVSDIYDDTNSIISLGAAADTLQEIADIVSDPTASTGVALTDKVKAENAEKIKKVLNLPTAVDVAKDIVKQVTGDETPKLANIVVGDVVAGIKNKVGDIKLSTAEQTSFTNVLKGIYGNSADATQKIKQIIDEFSIKKTNS